MKHMFSREEQVIRNLDLLIIAGKHLMKQFRAGSGQLIREKLTELIGKLLWPNKVSHPMHRIFRHSAHKEYGMINQLLTLEKEIKKKRHCRFFFGRCGNECLFLDVSFQNSLHINNG